MDDFLRLKPFKDVNKQDVKETTTAMLDIHLDDPRRYPATLYPHIYGVPQIWLSLLSQTTRLANAMDNFNVRNISNHDTFRASFRRKVDKLESWVCACAADEKDSSTTSSSHMLVALKFILVIYFYHRIRQVNPLVLQGHVDTVMSALDSLNSDSRLNNAPGPGTAWPAFIAGCEALTPRRREFLDEWMINAAQKTGFAGQNVAGDVMRKAWAGRFSSAGSPEGLKAGAVTDDTWTWEFICRDQKIRVMLS